MKSLIKEITGFTSRLIAKIKIENTSKGARIIILAGQTHHKPEYYIESTVRWYLEQYAKHDGSLKSMGKSLQRQIDIIEKKYEELKFLRNICRRNYFYKEEMGKIKE